MNKEAAKILRNARESNGFTLFEMADLLGKKLKQTYSQRQYQKLEDGDFPKYKKEIVLALDELLGTNLYKKIYEQNVPHNSLPVIDQKLIDKQQSIERSIELLTEDRNRVLYVIERLTTLLEKQYSGVKKLDEKAGIDLGDVDNVGTETRKKTAKG